MKPKCDSCDKCKYLFEDISYLECEKEGRCRQLMQKEWTEPCLDKDYYHDCTTCKHFQKSGEVAFTIKHTREDGSIEVESIPDYRCDIHLEEIFNHRKEPEKRCAGWELNGSKD